MKSFCIPLLLWVLLKVYPLLCNYNTEDPLGWKKNRKKILEVVELCEKKNTYRKQTSLFARGIIIWGSIWIDLLKEKYSLPLSLWYQSQRNYGSKQSIDCELRVNQYCVKKTRKKKKKGIICLLWCEGLRVAVWIQVSEKISSWIMKTSLRRKCIITCCYIIDISCTRSNCPLFWF